MSENIKVVKSAKHFMVLDAISRGVADAGKIAKVTKVDKAEVEMVVNDLAVQRLVIAEQKRGLFGSKIQARITETGSGLLASKKQDLEEKARGFKDMYRNGDRQGMQSFMNDNRTWLPMMIFSGIMSAVMFASIMSFMGMAMNPEESAMAGDSANADAQGTAADTQSEAAADVDGGTADSSRGGADNTSGFDAGDFGGDFEF
ncbi:MAG TPA: MarR family transcriptional regulator [Nitrososphaera sp.]|nr:MarR family transcriptional regulator [Nitrososphaera sp.]